MRKLLVLAFLLALSTTLKAQTIVPLAAGAAVLNVSTGGYSFKVPVTAAATVTIVGQPTFQAAHVYVLFAQDGTGHAVTFSTGFKSGATPTIPTTASSATSVSFQYDGSTNLWYVVSGPAAGGVPATVPVATVTTGTDAVALHIGSSGSLDATGSGTIDSTTLLTKTWAAPAAIGTGTPAASTFTTVTANTSVTSPLYATTTKCAATGSGANPSIAACAAAPAGFFSCATAATGGTCQVNTTAVTANSVILVEEIDTTTVGTAIGVTCNTSTTVIPTSRLLASSVAATSFTINVGTITTNPACFEYTIIN